jgi:hypothetical protein
MSVTECIVTPGKDLPSLWECACGECRRLQAQANADLDD